MPVTDFEFKSIEGSSMPLSRFAGHPMLIVNVASQCGFTPQYAELQQLHEKYGGEGLIVLGVPSNDFGAQEPDTEASIQSFCQTRYGVSFPMTQKQAVIGANAHPVYRWIAAQLGEDQAPRWNFHKYLVGRDGELRDAWPSRVAPMSAQVTQAVEEALRT
jgi:glutathione peroxidase